MQVFVTEDEIANGLSGCFFALTDEGKVVNRGVGVPPWVRKIWEDKKPDEVQKKSAPGLEGISRFARKRPDMITAMGRVPSFEKIVETVAEIASVEPEKVVSKDRTRRVREARQACVILLYKLYPFGAPWVARKIGLDHSTVFHALHLEPEKMEKIEPFVTAALDVFRAEYDSLDDVMTKISIHRIQSLPTYRRQECQNG